LAVIACLSLVLALYVPPLRGQRDVFDVLAVMDITQSMNVLDYRLNGVPASRLAFAKHALQEGLLQLPCGSKLGLAVFSERRTLVLFTPVEVCRNRAELTAAIKGLGVQMAWANASEISLGLHGALQITREVPEKPALVFITDGHEAPPINPRYRPRFDGRPGEVQGFIVGAGDSIPQSIPKIGPDGNSLGVWRSDEVLQTDLYSRGRAGSISGEQMVDTGGPAAPLPSDQPGGEEQLSALHEQYLELLASETGLRYRRLTDARSLAAVLTDGATTRREPAPVDVRWAWGTVALAALLMLSLPPRLSPLRNG
jgi:mxaL protein